MKSRTPNSARLVVALLLTGAIATVTAVHFWPIGNAVVHADDHPNNNCGARGTYGYTGFGNTFPGNLLGFPAGIVSVNGTITLDGNGNWFVREAEVVNGVVQNLHGAFGGTYTVNHDCTFSAALPPLPAGQGLIGVVVNNGKQIRAMLTIPGVQVNYVSTVRVAP